jgi:predicted nicotinamide N-methyase
MASEEPLFNRVDGVAHFRGLRVEDKAVTVAGRTFQIAGLKDAADLLDDPDFAKRFVEEDRAPYGMELWPASQMLADHILLGEDGANRRAIEVGCGLGLVSMAATIKGWRVLATDHEPTPLRFAKYNADVNHVCVAGYALLDWHNPAAGNLSEPQAPARGCASSNPTPKRRRGVKHPPIRPPSAGAGSSAFDRLFAADVLYQLVDHAPILGCIDHLLTPDGAAFICDPNRSVADRFASLASDRDWEVEVLTASTTFRTTGQVNGRIFLLRRPGGK